MVEPLAPGTAQFGDEEFDPWPAEIETPALIRSSDPNMKAISEIGGIIAGSMGVSVGSLQSNVKVRLVVAAKVRFAAECVAQGHSIKAIADWLGCHPQGVSYYLSRNSANFYA